MALQTVYRLTSRDGFEGLQAFQEPVPQVSSHEVLIKVRSCSLNHREIAIATSTYSLPVKDSVVPCIDMAGEVIQVGNSVTAGFLALGDRVIAPLSPSVLYGIYQGSPDVFGSHIDGMLREYVSLPAHILVKLPRSLPFTFAEWAAVACTGSTAWNALFGNRYLKPGDTVLLLGTGGVSLTTLIFAKAAGATTIVTSSSDDKLAQVKSKFGVDHTINYLTYPDWSAEVLRVTDDHGADHIIEVGGTGTLEQSLKSAAFGGHISIIGTQSEKTATAYQGGMTLKDITGLVTYKSCVLRGIMGGSKQQLEEAVRFIANRRVSMPVDKTFDFTRNSIIEAYEYVASGRHVGKVCINLD